MKLDMLKGVRGRASLIATAATLLAMILVVAATAHATRLIIADVITDSLSERLDAAEQHVNVGDYESAMDSTGNTLLQIVDADGNVVASTDNAAGLAALAFKGTGDAFELDDFEFEIDDDDDDVDKVSSSASKSSGGSSSSSGAAARDDDDDDDDVKASASTKASAKTNATSDSDDSDDDDRDDGDQDSDDDDDEGNGGRHADVIRFMPMLSLALAAEPAENPVAGEPYIDASNVLGEDGPYLVMTREVESPQGPVTLVAMTSLKPAIDAAWQMALMLIVIFVILLALVAVFSWKLTGRTLKPVEEIRATAEQISATDLDKRVSMPENDVEMERLATTFNDMLSRLEASVDDQKRFVSNASHELKSPIAALGLMVETLKAHPDDVDATQVLDDAEYEVKRLNRIVEDLLTLARFDEGTVAIERNPIDLCDVLYEEAALLRSRTSLEIDTTGVTPLICLGDQRLIGHAVRNYLDNASHYADTAIRISCKEADGMARIIVEDDGPGIAPENRERVFQRFERVEEARAHDNGSTGLGLAVVRSIAIQHGGRAYFSEPSGPGAVAVLEIPLA